MYRFRKHRYIPSVLSVTDNNVPQMMVPFFDLWFRPRMGHLPIDFFLSTTAEDIRIGSLT